MSTPTTSPTAPNWASATSGIYDRDFGNSLSQRSTFRLGTSIAVAGDAVSIGRPIYDSFAIVKPHRSLKGADVMVEPTPFGYTANSGALGAGTMAGLSSYSERTVPVDVANAPVGTDIGQGSFKLFPAYRSGYVLEVGSDYNVTALGTMVNVDGQPVALVSGTATELGPSGQGPGHRCSPTAKGGSAQPVSLRDNGGSKCSTPTNPSMSSKFRKTPRALSDWARSPR